MALTLTEAKVGMTNKIYLPVVDTLVSESHVLTHIPFDNAVSAGMGGSTFTYGYVQVLTPSTAQGRKINQEYTPSEAKKVEKAATCVISGGTFELDRQIIKTSPTAAKAEVQFQLEQKSKATANRFTYLTFYGKYATTKDSNSPEFDGLKQLLAGTENTIATTIDVSVAMTETLANSVCNAFDEVLASMSTTPDAIYMNTKTLLAVKHAARTLGYWERSADEFGRLVDKYNGIPMIDLKDWYNGTKVTPIIPIDAAGKSDIFFVTYGLNAFHGVSPMGQDLGLDVALPDINNGSTVIGTGRVEMNNCVALKNSKTCAVLTGMKVKAVS